MGHIFCAIFIALYVSKFGLYQFHDEKGGAYWAPIFKFIHRSSTNYDRLIKIMIINKVLFVKEVKYGMMPKEDEEFKNWLNETSSTGFRDIKSFKDLKDNIHRNPFLYQLTFSENAMTKSAINRYDGLETKCNKYMLIFLEKLMSYIALPIYLFGRSIHLIFPIIIYLINIGIYGIGGVLLLHHVLTLTFIILLIIMFCILYKVIYFTYCIYHIGYWGTAPYLKKPMIKEIEDAYLDIIQLPVIIDFFDETFGEDVSKLIVMYMKSIQLS